jgi:hypothetical protein
VATVSTGALADTFKLTTGEEITGELLPTSANESGVQIKVGEGQYKRVSWNNFSQEDLKKFAQYPKLELLVEPFIEITQEETIARTEVNIKQPPHLDRLPKQGLFGAMFSSGVGLFILFILWAATIYAGYEVALFRAQPPILVAGLSAVPLLGILVPIFFLIIPTKLQPMEDSVAIAAGGQSAPGAADAPVSSAEQAVNPMLAEGVAHPAGLRLKDTTQIKDKAPVPASQVFPRGQFTFNRRFFETKFPGFFGVVKRVADKDMILVFKTARGQSTLNVSAVLPQTTSTSRWGTEEPPRKSRCRSSKSGKSCLSTRIAPLEPDRGWVVQPGRRPIELKSSPV